MWHSRWRALMAAALVSACFIGCGGGGGADDDEPVRTKRPKTASTETKTVAKGKLEPIESTETAVLKGKVVYDGPPPDGVGRSIKDDDQFSKNEDKAHCLTDPTKNSETDLTWVIGPQGGVANVAVWVLPGDGKYFKLPDKPSWPSVASTDQPYCAFEPRVQLHFPGTPGADKKLQKSGQTFKIMNSAPIAHNTKYEGSPLDNIGGNPNLPPKNAGDLTLDLPPNTTTVVTLQCSRHPWMRGYVWSLPTPYAAVTDKDGNFKIEGIPANAPVKIVFWHEVPGFFSPNGAKGEPATLKPGDNIKDMKVKK